MPKKNKPQDITISFEDSMSAEEVTGSKIYLESEKKILLECGLYYGKSPLDSYRINSRQSKFKPKELDYIFLCHMHIDHIGLTPLLFKRGCNAEVIVPTGSKQILFTMLSNSAMIINGDAQYLSKKLGKLIEPLYTQEDVYTMMNHVIEYDLYQDIELDEYTQFKFISSGHIVNAASLMLKLKKSQQWKSIYYTSDLGNIKFKSYFTNNLDKVKNADIVISECTYGTKDKSCTNKDQRDRDIERLKNVINQYCVEQKGKVLIPVFSLHRGQQMASILHEMYHNDRTFNIPIYMDSMLLADITALFKKMFPNFREVMEWDKINVIDKESRQALQQSDRPMIVLASSGMLNAGSSVSWLQSMIHKSNNCIVFCGYCGEGTLGWKIKLKDQKTINIQGKPYKNKIQIVKLKSFSGHIQYDDLLSYLSNINTQRVILHHGDMSGRISFKRDLEAEYEKLCKTTTVSIANKSMKIHI